MVLGSACDGGVGTCDDDGRLAGNCGGGWNAVWDLAGRLEYRSVSICWNRGEFLSIITLNKTK